MIEVNTQLCYNIFAIYSDMPIFALMIAVENPTTKKVAIVQR